MAKVEYSFTLAKKIAKRHGLEVAATSLEFSAQDFVFWHQEKDVINYGISFEDAGYEEQVATLLHEICHRKYVSNEDSFEVEYLCDAFAVECGYGEAALRNMLNYRTKSYREARQQYLDLLAVCPDTEGTFEDFVAEFFEGLTHPTYLDRINRIVRLLMG